MSDELKASPADATRPDEAELLVQTEFPEEEFPLPSQEPTDLGKEVTK